jgi:hypothetical protein
LRAHRFVSALLLLLVAHGAAAQTPVPGQGSTGRAAIENARPLGPLPVFEFHSGFWINLHHVLYQQARLRAERPTTRSQTNTVQPSGEVLSFEDLSGAERSAWTQALAAYQHSAATRDLLFDTGMVRMKDRLAEMADTDGAEATGFTPDLVAALRLASPVYRAHWWPADDRSNRAWIQNVSPMVERLGAQLARQLAAVYQTNWPAGNIRVDVCAYAGLFGGYTTLDPLDVTVSSRDPRNQGETSLEILFHEASHALAEPVRDAIARECRAQNKPIPRELWHALLFYTTGEMVRHSLAAPATERGAGYEPYAYRQGLYVRDWQNYERALDQFWRPYLEGRSEFSRAIAQLVSSL